MKNKIKILGRTNTIVFEDRDPTSNAMGRANSAEDQIWIWNGMTLDATRETLIHEILHQISEYADLDLSEQQVAMLGIALNQLDFDPVQVGGHS